MFFIGVASSKPKDHCERDDSSCTKKGCENGFKDTSGRRRSDKLNDGTITNVNCVLWSRIQEKRLLYLLFLCAQVFLVIYRK